MAHTPEHRQRIHELREAHTAARHLENRLAMCIGWASGPDEEQRAARIRRSIAAALIDLGVPMGDFE